MSEQRLVPFDVHIPNVHGTGVAEVITIQVPVVKDINSGEDLITGQGMTLIEQTKFKRVMELYKQLGKENEQLKAKLRLLEDVVADYFEAAAGLAQNLMDRLDLGH